MFYPSCTPSIAPQQNIARLLGQITHLIEGGEEQRLLHHYDVAAHLYEKAVSLLGQLLAWAAENTTISADNSPTLVDYCILMQRALLSHITEPTPQIYNGILGLLQQVSNTCQLYGTDPCNGTPTINENASPSDETTAQLNHNTTESPPPN